MTVRVIEQRQRLSSSVLWTWLSQQYVWLGPQAWRQVPSFVTTHAGITHAFARLAAEWHRDLRDGGAVDPALPLCVIELGGGSGRFAHGFLRFFGRDGVRYLWTDGAEANVRAAAEHPALKQHGDAISFARFELTRPVAPVLPAGAPVVIVATYVFDSLAHDFFRVERGVLEEGLITLTGEPPTPETYERAVRTLGMHYDFEPVTRPRYDHPTLEAMLSRVAAREGSSTLMPSVMVAVLEAIAHGRQTLLLAADKAWVDPKEVMYPHFALHGTMSSMTNFAALRDWAAVTGGEALISPRRTALAYAVVRRDRLAKAPLLTRAFDDWIVSASPEDRRVRPDAGHTPAGAPLFWYWAALRVACCEPRAVVEAAPGLRVLASRAGETDVLELEAILSAAAALFFRAPDREPFVEAALRLLLAFGRKDRVGGILGPLVETYGLDLAAEIAKAEAQERPLDDADRTLREAHPALHEEMATLRDAQALLMQLQLQGR